MRMASRISGRTRGAGLYAVAAAGMMFTLVAGAVLRQVRLPDGVSFEPRDPANLAFNAVVGERCRRVFTITNTSNRPVKVQTLNVAGADFVRVRDVRGRRLAPGEQYALAVVYAPARQGARTQARISFNVTVGTTSRSAEVTLTGAEGQPCAQPPQEEDEGGGAAPDDPAEPGLFEPDFNDLGAVPQDDRKYRICVRVHFVSTGWGQPGGGGGQRPTPERLKQCFEAVSDWFRGVDFELRPADGAPEQVESTENIATDDPHCINVYIVHDQWFEQHPEPGDTEEETRRKAGHTEMQRPLRGPGWLNGVKPDLAGAGVAGGYLDRMAAGTRITIEAGDHLCSTLGHELAHALGLGEGPNKEHRDPGNNQPIQDGSRLVHRNGNGSRLTDLEQAIAKRVAQYMDETMLLKCDNTRKVIEDPEPPPQPPRNDFRRAGIFNQGESLRFEVRTAHPFDARAASPRVAIDIDADLDGAADFGLLYRFSAGEWHVEASPAVPDSMSLPLPSFDGPAHTADLVATRAISIEVPKDVVPGETSVIGWRASLLLDGFDARETLPAAFDTFDMAAPELAITLESGAELRVVRGAGMRIAGNLYTSSTFSGDVALHLAHAAADGALQVLPLTILRAAGSQRWSADIDLPAGLSDGRHEVTVLASCTVCRVHSGVVATLLVSSRGPIRFTTPWTIVILVLLVAIGVLAVLRRPRGEFDA